jgi:hypothetical protein
MIVCIVKLRGCDRLEKGVTLEQQVDMTDSGCRLMIHFLFEEKSIRGDRMVEYQRPACHMILTVHALISAHITRNRM